MWFNVCIISFLYIPQLFLQNITAILLQRLWYSMILCIKYKNKILLSKTVFSVISVIFTYRIILSNNRLNLFKLEATPGFEPGIRVLQTRALATWLCRHIWSGKRGSNPRPLPWQGSALSTELFPHFLIKYILKTLK